MAFVAWWIPYSLSHLNNFLEFYVREDYTFLKAWSVVGFQLGNTVIFGVYASFLLIQTGHLAAPLVAHIFCNFMDLPALFSSGSEDCKCWHSYCAWS